MEEYSDIVQVPVVYVNGDVLRPLDQYSKLDMPTLRDIADVMGGEVRHLKLRATYSLVETNLCGHRDCYRPAKNGRCSDHDLVKSA